ncbi:MAG TPA: L,D-transpeptidase family protein [Thermoanaerobaculia bacterium]|nr:L,D-transpeptidase family protein [Thermoanaerobaculia bacterium]
MRLRILLCVLPLLLTGCVYEDATDEKKTGTTDSVGSAASQDDISVPDAGETTYEAAELEKLRRDASWRAIAERDRAARAAALARRPSPDQTSDLTSSLEPPPAPSPSDTEAGAPVAQQPGRVPASPESFDQITPDTLSLQPHFPVARDGGGPTILRAQILLDRARFSPGVIDGNWGQNTEKAIFWFQNAHNLQATGEIDRPTWDALTQAAGRSEPLRHLTLTEQDLRGPFVDLPDDVYARAKLDCLCYESPLEMLAERSHSTPDLLRQLNPQADFDRLAPGEAIWTPNVTDVLAQQASGTETGATPAANPAGGATPRPSGSAVGEIVISKKGYYLQALDGAGNILYHFPSTLGSKYDPSPSSGDYKITSILPRPEFHYQPALMADVPDTKENAQLPPGPNSPVGLVWMQLSKPHNGIHGTAVPETIGYASSHGCVRLTNWDAVFLSEQVRPGVRVRFVE